jgi:tetratricopeptide (TPR) repeat protein
MYEKLKQIQALKYKDRKALNEVMSANRRAIGNLLLGNGRLREARDCYRRALFTDPSIASLGKYVLSFLPAKTNLRIIEKNFGLKVKRSKN